ncbi:MAG: hypothetical protein WCW25_00145 [Patescibacteria group bacterium]
MWQITGWTFANICALIGSLTDPLKPASAFFWLKRYSVNNYNALFNLKGEVMENLKNATKVALLAIFILIVGLFIALYIRTGVEHRRVEENRLFSLETVGQVAVGVLLDEAASHPEARSWFLVPRPWAEDSVRNAYEKLLNDKGFATRESANGDRFRETWRSFLGKCQADPGFAWEVYQANRAEVIARAKANPALTKEVAFFAAYLEFVSHDGVVRDLVTRMWSQDEERREAYLAARDKKLAFVQNFEGKWKQWKDESSREDIDWTWGEFSLEENLGRLRAEEQAAIKACKGIREAQEEVKKSLLGYLRIAQPRVFEIRGVDRAALDAIIDHWLSGSQIVNKILLPVYEAERLRRDGRLDVARSISNDLVKALKTE